MPLYVLIYFNPVFQLSTAKNVLFNNHILIVAPVTFAPADAMTPSTEFFLKILFSFFFFFLKKTGFDISCRLSPLETNCMKCEILHSGKNRKCIILSLSELLRLYGVFYFFSKLILYLKVKK